MTVQWSCTRPNRKRGAGNSRAAGAATNLVITWVSEFTLGTTQGAFAEAAIYVQVKYRDYEGDYEPFLYINNHLPLTGGREIWGFQKKMADVGLFMSTRPCAARSTA